MAKKQAKGYKKITQKDFDTVHTLVGVGLKVSQIKKIMGRSEWTITKLKDAKTLDEYTERTRKESEKYKVKPEEKNTTYVQDEKPLTSTVTYTDLNNETETKLSTEIQILEILTKMNENLEKLVAIDRIISTEVAGKQNNKKVSWFGTKPSYSL